MHFVKRWKKRINAACLQIAHCPTVKNQNVWKIAHSHITGTKNIVGIQPCEMAVKQLSNWQIKSVKGWTIWERNLFSSLPRARWEGWYNSHYNPQCCVCAGGRSGCTSSGTEDKMLCCCLYFLYFLCVVQNQICSNGASSKQLWSKLVFHEPWHERMSSHNNDSSSFSAHPHADGSL